MSGPSSRRTPFDLVAMSLSSRADSFPAPGNVLSITYLCMVTSFADNGAAPWPRRRFAGWRRNVRSAIGSVEEPVLEGVQGEAGSTLEAELVVHVHHVLLRRARRHAEERADLRVRASDRHEPHDLDLAVREATRPRVLSPGREPPGGQDELHGPRVEGPR